MATPVASHPQDNSFLSRCIEDLSPNNITSHECYYTLWVIVAGVTTVAFMALCIVGFTYISAYFAASAPFAGLTAYLAASLATSFTADQVLKMLEYAKASKKEAGAYRSLQLHAQALSTKTPAELRVELRSRGIIQIVNLQNPTSLTPLLARAKHLDDKIQEDLKLKQSLSQQARDLATTDFLKNRNQIFSLRQTALFVEERALRTKIEAAFTNAVLRKGNYQGSLESMATLTDCTYQERALGNELGDLSGVRDFLFFKNRSLQPIARADVKRMTVPELGQHLAAAMT